MNNRELEVGLANPAERPEDSAADIRRKVALAKTVAGITMREGGNFKAEESVYGAALVLPQVARTVGWSKSMTMMAIRSLLFLFLNFYLQSYLLRMLAKEQHVMDVFAGKMHLCDFGAFIENCPGLGCLGPGGSDLTPPRMYGFEAWVNRNFVRDSLKAIFPDRIDDIEHLVDPGEYGVESYWCRLTCCFIFMIALMWELTVVVKMVTLLWSVPTADQPWIVEKDPEDIKGVEIGSLDAVQLKIAGMPMKWKIINSTLIVLPKALLFKQTAETGITFLMETSGIQDIIVNSVGLAFILNLDELIYSALMSEEEGHIVELCEDYPLYDLTSSCVGDISSLSDAEVLERYEQTQKLTGFLLSDLKVIIPQKLLCAALCCCLLVLLYYQKNCQMSAEGRLVSKDMYLPKDATYSWQTAFLPNVFDIEREETPFWKMPSR